MSYSSQDCCDYCKNFGTFRTIYRKGIDEDAIILRWCGEHEKEAAHRLKELKANTVKTAKTVRPVYWQGDVTDCQLCHEPLTHTMIDGATTTGPWAILCIGCHMMKGRGLGTGKGQKYQKQVDGQWLKVAG